MRGALLDMRDEFERLFIGDGFVHLGWSGSWPVDGDRVLPDPAVAVVTTIARRLVEA